MNSSIRPNTVNFFRSPSSFTLSDSLLPSCVESLHHIVMTTMSECICAFAVFSGQSVTFYLYMFLSCTSLKTYKRCINEKEWSPMVALWEHYSDHYLLIIQAELIEASSCQRMKCCIYCMSPLFFVLFYFIEDSCYKTEFVVFSFLSLLFIFLFFTK